MVNGLCIKTSLTSIGSGLLKVFNPKNYWCRWPCPFRSHPHPRWKRCYRQKQNYQRRTEQLWSGTRSSAQTHKACSSPAKFICASFRERLQSNLYLNQCPRSLSALTNTDYNTILQYPFLLELINGKNSNSFDKLLRNWKTSLSST